MQTLLLTIPELEQAARQWAVDFLHERWEAVPVVTRLEQVQRVPCEDRTIVLFERTTPEVLEHVLQDGGHPWLVCDVVNRTPHSMRPGNM